MATKIATVHGDPCGPVFDNEGTLHVAGNADGALTKISVDGSAVVANTAGQPTALAYSPGNSLYAADHAHAAIIHIAKDGNCQVVVREYEGEQFKVCRHTFKLLARSSRRWQGPSALAFAADGTFYFTDSGPFGESTLQTPNGSCFAVTGPQSARMLQPIALRCLAHPSGISLGVDDSSLYVPSLVVDSCI